jgi:GT2 family glycosyltransferase
MTDQYYVQYGNGTFITGWCLTVKREIFKTITLNEEVNFWCSDNTYQDDLIKHGIKHALVRDSIVDHLGGVTLFSMTPKQIHNYTATQAQIYATLPK